LDLPRTHLRLARGGVKREDWLVYLLAALFIARFIYLGRT
jgi:hypothetical protein